MTVTTPTGSFLTDGFRRGDYLSFSGMPQYAVTTSGLARGKDLGPRRQRVVHAAGATLTVRDVERWHAMEWILARAEDWFLWPAHDISRSLVALNARIRSR